MKTNWKYAFCKSVNWFLPLCFLAFLPLSAFAQHDFTPVHRNCLSEGLNEATAGHRAGAERKKLPTPRKDWNPNKVYRQLVILIEQKADSASYLEFSYAEDAHTFYDKMFNEPGFNEENGLGCMADYFRDQSQGMLNLQFDVYGPVKVSTLAQPFTKPSSQSYNSGKDAFIEATNKVIAEHPEIDFSVYDWNDDHRVDQVLYVYS